MCEIHFLFYMVSYEFFSKKLLHRINLIKLNFCFCDINLPLIGLFTFLTLSGIIYYI